MDETDELLLTETEFEVENENTIPEEVSRKDSTMSFWFFFIQGCATIVFWNSLISCPDYFLALYPPYIMVFDYIIFPTHHQFTQSVISFSYMTANIITFFLFTFVSERISFYLKNIIPHLYFIFVLIAIPILGYLPLSEVSRLAITVTLVTVGGCFAALMNAAVFGAAGNFPNSSRFNHGIMFGQGICAFGFSIIRVATKAILETSSDDDPVKKRESVLLSALAYYVLGVFAEIGFLLSLLLIPFSSHLQKYINKRKENKKSIIIAPPLQEVGRGKIGGGDSNFREKAREYVRKVVDVFYYNSVHFINIFLIFFVSIAIFPGVSSVVESEYFGDWMSVIMSLTFTIFDFIGRTAPGYSSLRIVNRYLFTFIVYARVLFLFLFFLFIDETPGYLENDILKVLCLAAVGVSNGYVSTAELMQAGEKVQSLERRRVDILEINGLMMNGSMLLGIFGGSWMSMLLLECGLMRAQYLKKNGNH